MSGYLPCACRDCLEVAIGVPPYALCSDCSEAGCDPEGAHECAVDPFPGDWVNPDDDDSSAFADPL